MKAKIGSFGDGNSRLIATISPEGRRRQQELMKELATGVAERERAREEAGDKIGSWPDPKCPGVPLYPDRNGAHWMRWAARSQALTIGVWSHDLQRWVLCYLGGFATPAEMAHLNYVCEAEPPGPWTLP